MRDMPQGPSFGADSLPLRRRFAGFIDENGAPAHGWEVDKHGEWLEKWPPCPDGDPVELRHALGFRERNIAELELRVLLGSRDDGVCQVIVDEREDEVHVRVLVHRSKTRRRSRRAEYEYLDCPTRVSLVLPLGERAVVDMDSDEELALYTPEYLNNVLQPDHGYRAVARRRRAAGRDVASPEGVDGVRAETTVGRNKRAPLDGGLRDE